MDATLRDAVGKAAMMVKVTPAAEHAPAAWMRLLAERSVHCIDIMDCCEQPIDIPPSVAVSTAASFKNMSRSQETARRVQTILEARATIDYFDLLPEVLCNWFCSLRALPNGGVEEWQIYHFATDTTSHLHRPVTILMNAVEAANDHLILRSELQSVLILTFAVLRNTPLPNPLYNGQICATVFSAVRCKTRVLHASIEEGRVKITCSRYFELADEEALLAASRLELLRGVQST